MLRCMSLLMAQSRHPDRVGECPLSGVKRTSKFKSVTSAFDPNRTSADAVGLSANCRQLGLLDQLVCARDEVRKRLRIRRVCPTSYCPLLAIARERERLYLVPLRLAKIVSDRRP